MLGQVYAGPQLRQLGIELPGFGNDGRGQLRFQELGGDQVGVGGPQFPGEALDGFSVRRVGFQGGGKFAPQVYPLRRFHRPQQFQALAVKHRLEASANHSLAGNLISGQTA